MHTYTPEVAAAMAAVRLLPTRGHTPEAIAAFKRGGRITCAAVWDNLTPALRQEFRPDLNPDQRWYQQRAWKHL